MFAQFEKFLAAEIVDTDTESSSDVLSDGGPRHGSNTEDSGWGNVGATRERS